MMHLELMGSRFDAANNMAGSPLLSKIYIQKEVLKLSDSEIATIKLESEQEAQQEHFMEQLKMGEQPGMGAPMGGEETETETERIRCYDWSRKRCIPASLCWLSCHDA